MSKIKLIYNPTDMPNFTVGCILPLITPYFDLVPYDPTATYSRDHAVLTTYQQDFVPTAWFRSLEQAGHRIVVDHLLDSDVDTPSFRIHDTKLDLRSGHWMWYHTAILAQANGYDQFVYNPKYTHDFLCLMNKQREHRDRVQQDLAQQLATARWSYVERGRDIGDPNERCTPVFWEFYNNPEWYNSTPWSLVVESYMRGDPWFAAPSYPNYRTEISEKTYKPLAYYHPFIVIGSEGTLRWIKSQGFETWDNLWDESYDTIASDAARLDHCLAQTRDVVLHYNSKTVKWDLITELKLEHNHNRFFNQQLVHRRFQQEIVGDILEFLN